jgi:hypothetical protein
MLRLPFRRSRTWAISICVNVYVALNAREMLWHLLHPRGFPVAKKKSKRRSWTIADAREFRKLARAKTSAAKLARRFKRSVGAIRQKALRLGVSLNSRR